MTLSSGTTIDIYEIVGQLGAGGMGEVYRARDRKLGRDVALKILPRESATSEEHLRRFEQEARAASALNHPSIVTIYEIGQHDDIAFIAMELVEGRDLRDLMTETEVPLKQIVRIAGRVAEGLAAAHERGIVHRDLKPENLMITSDGYVKVLDFGLAKLAAAPMTANDTTLPHTTPGAVFGTVGYMSPEQASGKLSDYRSDQFSFGVILFEMIARRRPFDRNTAPETLTAIIREEHPHLRDIDAAVPADLDRIVDRCLQKDPADRYASTRDLARDLREVRDALTNPSGRRSGSHIVPRRFPARKVAAMAAGLLLLSGGAYFATKRSTPQRPPAYRSVAVLPFRDLSPSKDSQLFTDGLSEMITTRLAQSKAVRVVSPFDGAELPATATLKEIADRRGADVLLRGGVQRSEGQLRITYALLDANGTQLGGDTVTASSSDLFAAQDLVADSVLKQLGASAKPTYGSTRRDSLESAEDQKQYAEALGLIHRIRGDASTEDAVRRLEALLANARDSALVNAALARALVLRYGQTRNAAFVEQANVYATRAAAIDPALPDVHVTLGDLRKNSGNLNEALSEYSKALELRRDYPDALLGLAETYDKMGRGAQAEKTYADVMRLSPDWPSVYAKFGGYWYARGTYDKAIVMFRRMTELMPDSPRGYSNLGGAYIGLGKYDAAITAFERAVAIDSKSSNALTNLGICYYMVGDYAKSASYFERAAHLKPDDYILWANLGDARRWSGNDRKATDQAYESAVSAARKSAAINPNDALLHAVVASSLAKLGKADEAKREADLALQIDPTNSDALYHAAVTAHLRGDDAAAMGWLGRAVRAGYARSSAEHDPEWKAVRTNPEFRNALKSS